MRIIIEPANMGLSGLKAFFTTRALNLANAGDCDVLSGELGIPRERVYLPLQRHTGIVHVLDLNPEPVIADAVITDRKNMFVGIIVADCVPILVFEREKKIIGAVHAGWRGTVEQVLKKTIRAMLARYHCHSEDILVAIGPSIRECCYEVGEDVATRVQRVAGEGVCCRREGNGYFLDIAAANKMQALDMNIPQENIWMSGECTFCNPEKFYSFRYSEGSCGRQGGFIGMW